MNRLLHSFATAFLLMSSGCGSAVLSVDDAVTNGEVLELIAYVEREPLLGLRKDVEEVRVRFSVDDLEVGMDRTDEDGRARVRHRSSTQATTFEATAIFDQREARTRGSIFHWKHDRTIIALDIDGTISETEFKDLILDPRDTESDPVEDSRRTMATLARDYQVLYLTARPRFLLEKTRRWLKDHRFPDGPVITARGIRQAMRPEAFKTAVLRSFRKRWPNLVIGIGNKGSDADAYGANEMLSLIVAHNEDAQDANHSAGSHAVIVQDWESLARIFAENRDILTNPEATAQATQGKTMLRLPVLPYEAD